MIRPLLYITVTVLMASCGGPDQAPTSPQEPTQAPPVGDIATTNQETAIFGGVDYYYHDTNAPVGETQKAVFHLHAKTARPGDEGTYIVEGVNATVFAKDDKDSDIIFDAPRGSYHDTKGVFLEGPITVNIGDSILELEDLNYYNPKEGQQGLITSDHDIKLNNPNLSLTGSSMRLDPATMNCTVTNVHAIIPLWRSQP